MTKKLFVLPLLALSTITLAACPKAQEKGRVTYGTYVDEAIVDISFDDVVNKMEGWEKGENFLLTIYPGKSSTCGCWANFKDTLNTYVKNKHVLVYAMDRYEVSSAKKAKAEGYGLTIQDKDQPYFYIVKDGKVEREYIYNTDAKMFKNMDALDAEIKNYLDYPTIYKVDEEYARKALFTDKKTANIYYYWSDCGDCQYSSPKVIWPYVNKNNCSKELLALEIGHIKNEHKEEGGTSSDAYKAIVKEFQLTEEGNSKFGYGRGFVPTIQHWEDGAITDSTVFFNDTVDKDTATGKFYVKTSFYSKTRESNIKYTKGVEVSVLEGLYLDEADVNDYTAYGYGYGWKQDAAAKYHKPLLEAFLNTYLK